MEGGHSVSKGNKVILQKQVALGDSKCPLQILPGAGSYVYGGQGLLTKQLVLSANKTHECF